MKKGVRCVGSFIDVSPELNKRMYIYTYIGTALAQRSTVTDFEINGFHYAPNGQYILFTQDVPFDLKPTDK